MKSPVAQGVKERADRAIRLIEPGRMNVFDTCVYGHLGFITDRGDLFSCSAEQLDAEAGFYKALKTHCSDRKSIFMVEELREEMGQRVAEYNKKRKFCRWGDLSMSKFSAMINSMGRFIEECPSLEERVPEWVDPLYDSIVEYVSDVSCALLDANPSLRRKREKSRQGNEANDEYIIIKSICASYAGPVTITSADEDLSKLFVELSKAENRDKFPCEQPENTLRLNWVFPSGLRRNQYVLSFSRERNRSLCFGS